MATIHADKTYTRLRDSRRKDHDPRAPQHSEELTEKPKLAEVSVIEPFYDAAEEQRLLEGMVRCYEEHGKEIMAEMQWWFDLPGPPLPDDDWSDVIPEDK